MRQPHREAGRTIGQLHGLLILEYRFLKFARTFVTGPEIIMLPGILGVQ